MPRIVEVPGQGDVEFPDEMNDDDIAAVIRKQQGSPDLPKTPDLYSDKAKAGFFQRLGEGLDPRPLFTPPKLPSRGGPDLTTREKVDLAGSAFGPGGRMLANIGAGTVEQMRRARAEWAAGNRGAALKEAATGIPIVGPVVRSVGEDIAANNWGGAHGTAASLMLPWAVGKARFTKGFTNALNPVERRAVEFGERRSVPVDAATATGDPFLQGTRAIIEKQPFTAGKMARLREGQEAKMARVGEDLAVEAAPSFDKRTGLPTGVARTKLGAGVKTKGALETRAGVLDQLADAAYSKFRKIADSKKEQVQTGWKESEILDANGMRQRVPVYEELSLPVDHTEIKATVAPIVEQIEKTLPQAQRDMSPGLTVLKQIISRPDKVSAATAIEDLSSIRGLARIGRNEIPAVRTQSQGLASILVPKLRKAIGEAAERAGPDAVEALDAGETATRAKHATLDFLYKDLHVKEPVKMVNRLIANEDSSIEALRTMRQMAPDAIPDLARSTLEGLLKQATQEGGFEKAKGALAAWNRIGESTKNILFGPAKTAELDDFFNLGKMIVDQPNPSGSATVGGIWGAILHPVKSIAASKLAESLLTTNGPRLAREGMRFNVGRYPGAMLGASAVGAQSGRREFRIPEPEPPPRRY